MASYTSPSLFLVVKPRILHSCCSLVSNAFLSKLINNKLIKPVLVESTEELAVAVVEVAGVLTEVEVEDVVLLLLVVEAVGAGSVEVGAAVGVK